MAAEVDLKSPSSPRIKFRWCRSVSCQTKEVYLILTSVTGGQVTLQWKDELGWYESDLVSLPCGLHSGFLLIRQKTPSPGFLKPAAPTGTQEIDERDYRIDPFFVTPHKFAVELFLQSSRSVGVWKADHSLREKYLSFHALESEKRERGSDGLKVECQRKSSSCQELNKCVSWPDENRLSPSSPNSARDRNDTELKEAKENGEGTVESARVTSGSSLKKWRSTGDKANLAHTPDSSYYSKSRSLQNDDTGDLGDQKDRDQTYLLVNRDSKSCGSDLPSKTLLFHTDLNELKLDVLARTKKVESLLTGSDEEETGTSFKPFRSTDLYFKEVNPPINEGYGCLITFESRSTSMDDLGSPRAFEDVLVSLTSTETEPKYFSIEKENNSSAPEEGQKDKLIVPDSQSISNSDNSSRVVELREGEEEEFENSTSDSDKIEKYPESDDITLNDDENFQYDSIKNDDETIPLNIRGVLDSDDSLNSNLNVDPRYKNAQVIHESGNLGVNKDPKFSPERSDTSEESNAVTGITGHYSFKSNEAPTSAKGVVATDPLILVHPGSLRSETEHGSPRAVNDGIEAEERLASKAPKDYSGSKRSRSVVVSRKVKGSPTSPQAKTRDLSHSEPKRGKKSTNLSKTIVIIKDKRPTKMSSTGTQTSGRAPVSHPPVSALVSRSVSSTAPKHKEKNLKYNTLPDRVSGPWTSKYINESSSNSHNDNNYPYSASSNVKNLQKSLYDIIKADQILKTIHPFDYRPTLIHNTTKQTCDSSAKKGLYSNKYSFLKEQNASSSLSSSLTNRQNSSESDHRPAPKIPANGRTFEGNLSRRSKPNRRITFDNPPRAPTGNPTSRLLSKYTRNKSRSLASEYRSALPPHPRSNGSIGSETAKAHFSIYGSKYLQQVGDSYYPSLGKYQTYAVYPYCKSSSLYRKDQGSAIRPASSLPDLRQRNREDVSRVRSRTTSTPPPPPPPQLLYQDGRDSYSTTPFSTRRRSLEERYTMLGSSGESTDSLIEEAENVASRRRAPSSLYSRNRGEYFSSFTNDNEASFRFRRRRARSSSTCYATDAKALPSPGDSFGAYRTSQQSSVADVIRTRSETDLRMVGTMSGGHQGEPPYLPYRKEHLSLGQVVKVLVPGEGVALARVVYNPLGDSFSIRSSARRSQDITVVLITEPTSLTGSVITVPINKVLLAWPKT